MTVTLYSSSGAPFVVDVEDAPLAFPYVWTDHVAGYLYRTAGGKTQLLHRVIMDPPHGLSVDHANGDKRDNRRGNLRVCTHQQNMRNRRLNENSTSGFKGVTRIPKRDGKWMARITVDYKMKYIGTYDTAEAAHAAYCEAAGRLHGEFARGR